MLPVKIDADEVLARARKLESAYRAGDLSSVYVQLGRLYKELSEAPTPTIIDESYRLAAGIFNRLLGDARQHDPRAFENLDYVMPV